MNRCEMERTVEYYLGLPYTRELIPEPEGGWFVRVKELPGCMSQGDTGDDALTMIEDAMRGWLEVELEKGSSIPEPRLEEEYSGKFIVRVARSLHRKISEIAVVEGVSLNQWISTTLAEAVGKTYSTKMEADERSVDVAHGLFRANQGVFIGECADDSDTTVN